MHVFTNYFDPHLPSIPSYLLTENTILKPGPYLLHFHLAVSFASHLQRLLPSCIRVPSTTFICVSIDLATKQFFVEFSVSHSFDMSYQLQLVIAENKD